MRRQDRSRACSSWSRDIQAAHAELLGRGVEVEDVQEFPWGAFVFFSDPDGNKWAVQEIPARG